MDANNSEGMSTVHVSALTAVGLYGGGWTWREATTIRDELVREAKGAEPQIAKRSIEGADLSFIILAGVASFQIDEAR